MTRSPKIDISIVIPALDTAERVGRILSSVEGQKLAPREVIVVDSSPGGEAEELVSNWGGAVPVVYRRVSFAYPGHARNMGAALSRQDWIAFLDCRTLPVEGWLQSCAEAARATGADIVTVHRTNRADSRFKETLLAATYGHEPVLSLSGSMVRRELFERSQGFVPSLRAGEDLEWMERLEKAGASKTTIGAPLLCYDGFPETLTESIGKWYRYAVAKATADVRNYQKLLYGTFTVLLCLFLVRNWNSLFAHWKRDSIFYVPNITKIFCGSLMLLYAVTRGFVYPIRKKVPLSFLLPFRWIELLFVRFCLDLAKAPGLTVGAFILFGKQIAQLVGKVGLKPR